MRAPSCPPKILLFANTDWYLFNFRRGLALALSAEGYEVLLVSPDGPFGERFAALGLRWIPAPMDRLSLNPFREIGLLFWLSRLMAHERIDLIHGFTIKCAVYGAWAARFSGVRARVDAVTGLGYVFTSSDTKARLLRPLVCYALRLALKGQGSRLILQNPDDVALFVQAGLVDPQDVRLIPGSGVDARRFVPGEPRRRGGRFRVLLPARLLWDKGLGEVVEAARRLRAEGVAIDVLLAGEPDPGNPAAVPESVIEGWVEEGIVKWLGYVEDMPGLYQSVDAVILPSYREGLPKGLIEGGACGLPLVTTDVPGCREVVTDGVDGILVPVEDAGALAEALVRLEGDPDACVRLGLAARAKALRCFEERLVIEQTINVYRELLYGGQRAEPSRNCWSRQRDGASGAADKVLSGSDVL